MRILHVHSGNIFGGVERIMVALARRREKSRDCEHAFALCFHDRLAHEIANSGAPLFFLPSFHFSRPWQLCATQRALAALLQQQTFDLAIVHSAWAHAAFARILRRAKLPILFWLHTHTAANSAIERLAQLTFPDGVLSVSRWVQESAENLFPGIPRHVALSPLAIDEEAFARVNRDTVRADFGIREGEVMILQASRMEAWKGHRLLFEALKLLPTDLPWKCWIAGGAGHEQERAYLDDLKSAAPARVTFLGERSDVPALLRAADVYCQANTTAEGFSIAFMEAAYAGLPIVTSALGGAMEIVDAQTGILVPPRDVRALAAALEKLIADSDLRQKLGANAREKVIELCDAERQFATLENIFSATINRHG